MLRMVWSEPASLPRPSPLVFRVGGDRLAELQSLYRLYADACFGPYQLMQGIFYGVERDGRLVAVAGTHLVAHSYGVAAVGNVFTHPDYRGRGLATTATRAVCDELLDRGIELIGLSVSRSNAAAIRVYEKIGFKRHVPFYEGTAIRLSTNTQNHQSEMESR